jgi:hypothetical protein
VSILAEDTRYPRLRIVVVNNFGSMIGGAEKVAITTALELSRIGFEVGFFSGGPLGNDFASSSVRTPARWSSGSRPRSAAISSGSGNPFASTL